MYVATVYQRILEDVKNGVLEDGLSTICRPDIVSQLPEVDTTLGPASDGESNGGDIEEEMSQFLEELKEEAKAKRDRKKRMREGQ